jgi:hypothetical protein
VIGSRVRGRRSGAILAATLFIIAAMPGLATAANTRGLLIGSPVLTGATKGILTLTPVSVPVSPNVHSTYLEVEILSTDNQNLSHTVLAVTLPKQTTDITVHSPYDPAGGTDADLCTRSDGLVNTVFTCDYGSITPANPERTIAFVMDVASTFNTATQAATFASAQVTTNNENGTNQQTFPADSGSFQVQARNANHLASWVPSGQLQKSFSTSGLNDSTSGDPGNLSSTITFDTSANETVSLTDGITIKSPTSKYQCPTVPVVLTCRDDYSEAVTTSGFFSASPYFTWTLTAKVTKAYSLSQGFLAHYDTNAPDYNWILFFKDKSSFCGSLEITSNGHCIKYLNLTKPVGGFSTLTITFVTDHQGGAKY